VLGVFFAAVFKSPDQMGILGCFWFDFPAALAVNPIAPIPAIVPMKSLLVSKFSFFLGLWEVLPFFDFSFLSDMIVLLP